MACYRLPDYTALHKKSLTGPTSRRLTFPTSAEFSSYQVLYRLLIGAELMDSFANLGKICQTSSGGLEEAQAASALTRTNDSQCPTVLANWLDVPNSLRRR